MAIIKNELEIAKELDDVMVLVIEVVKTIKGKGEYADLIDELISAVNGVDDIPNEIKNIEAAIRTIAPRVYNIIEVFTKKEVPTPIETESEPAK